MCCESFPMIGSATNICMHNMSYRDGAVVQGAISCLKGLTCWSAFFKVSIAWLWADCLCTPQSPFHLVSDLNSIHDSSIPWIVHTFSCWFMFCFIVVVFGLFFCCCCYFLFVCLFFPYFINEMDIVLSIWWLNLWRTVMQGFVRDFSLAVGDTVCN